MENNFFQFFSNLSSQDLIDECRNAHEPIVCVIHINFLHSTCLPHTRAHAYKHTLIQTQMKEFSKEVEAWRADPEFQKQIEAWEKEAAL